MLGLVIVSPATAARVPPRLVLGPTPAAVVHVCRERVQMKKFAVACPTRYPLAPHSLVTPSGVALRGPSFYWASFNDPSGFPDGDQGHLLIGGQRMPFSLAGQPGQTWPRPPQPRPVQQLPLPRLLTTPMAGGKTYIVQRPARVLLHAMVKGLPALVLNAPAHPEGGLSGGHIIVLWNRDGHGYLVSLHFAVSPTRTPYVESQRITAALAIAASCHMLG